MQKVVGSSPIIRSSSGALLRTEKVLLQEQRGAPVSALTGILTARR
jgi:hypothetical protein